MAKQEHVDLIRRGVEVWNQWRKKNPEIRPNLSGAILRGTNPINADLRSGSIHVRIGANLSNANLHSTDLSEANLTGADLRSADLSSADLSSAFLNWANLTGAKFIGANLGGTNLKDTNFAHALLGRTNFTDVDLRNVKALETVEHRGPSSIGIDTIYRSYGQIPEDFLRKAGVPASFLRAMAAITNQSIEYYTCFISVRLVSPKHVQTWGWAGKEYSFHN